LENLAATRMNLVSRRAQITLAADGAGLLKGKREALLKELIARARELRAVRSGLHVRGRHARVALAMARAVRGTPELRSVGVAVHRDFRADVAFEKVCGLNLARVEVHDIVRDPAERGLGVLDAPSHIVEAVDSAERVLEQLLICGPLEWNIERIGIEIRKTSRRINGLEEHLLPRLREDVRTIAAVLEEREREDIFRLKRVKAKRARGKSRSGAKANTEAC